jgi:hypothetical protein
VHTGFQTLHHKVPLQCALNPKDPEQLKGLIEQWLKELRLCFENNVQQWNPDPCQETFKSKIESLAD